MNVLVLGDLALLRGSPYEPFQPVFLYQSVEA
jgi:hypothetical protein